MIHYELHPGGSDQLQCDFCSAPNIVKDYACESFNAIELGPLVAESVGKWVACPICVELIDADKWEELAHRSFETAGYGGESAEVQDLLMGFIRRMHGTFKMLRMRAN